MCLVHEIITYQLLPKPNKICHIRPHYDAYKSMSHYDLMLWPSAYQHNILVPLQRQINAQVNLLNIKIYTCFVMYSFFSGNIRVCIYNVHINKIQSQQNIHVQFRYPKHMLWKQNLQGNMNTNILSSRTWEMDIHV